ncbi:MAG: hypothetical protein IKN63_02660 [Bacilli bacterium]|nr:hypothetical protein [Bacilli bacterium]
MRKIVGNNQKKMLITIIGLASLLLISSSYALFRSSVIGENTYTMNVGKLEVSFKDSDTNALLLTNMHPMSDKEGLDEAKELYFTVENTGNITAKYKIYIEETTDKSKNPDFSKVIRYAVNKDNEGYGDVKTLEEDSTIDQNSNLIVGGFANYKVKAWLAENANSTYMNKEFKARIIIEVNQ